MTGAERVLAELETGPKTAAELYARTFSVVHSRISDLRRAGYEITIERTGGQGAASFVYHLGGGRTVGDNAAPEAAPPTPSPLVAGQQHLFGASYEAA